MKRIVLDEMDVRILCALQEHGELSKSKLAILVGLSATSCWARFSRLTKAGLITRYHAEIALAKILDLTKVVVTVSLKRHRRSDFDRFEKHILQRHEVTDCISTGGGMDYVMTVVTTRLAAFQALMEDMLDADLGIDRYMIYIVTREIKRVQPNLGLLLSEQASMAKVA